MGSPSCPASAPSKRSSSLMRPVTSRLRCWASYLLKSRIADVEEFLDALQRIAKGGSVVDPALVRELVTARRREDPLAALSERERQVLDLMAEGRSNAGIARRLWVTEGTVEKHISSILTKLNLHEADDDHRRVLAVITFLKAR